MSQFFGQFFGPNLNAITDSQYFNAGVDVSPAGSLSPGYKNICAINYGRPGPSAKVNGDGTIAYTTIDLALSSNAFTDIKSDMDVTVAGNLTATTGTNYNPYADNGGTAYTLNLVNGPLASKYFLSAGYLGAWGMIAAPIATNYTALVLQIQSIVTQYIPGPSGRMFQPTLQISNPAQPGGQRLADWAMPIPAELKSTNTLSDNYTYVFAVNAGAGKTIDANGVQVGSVDIGVTGNSAYNLCNIGVVLPPGADGTAAATVAYKIKTNAGL